MKCIDFPYFSPKAVAVSGVYRLWFDEKWYYIGSTNNLRRRLLSWKFALLNNVPKNKNIKFILSEITNIRVEIVENCDNYREIEDKLIKESIDELLCLNRCPDATSNFGRRLAMSDTMKVSYKKERLIPNKVAAFTKDGVYLQTFNSRNQAAIALNTKTDRITAHLKGERGLIGGLRFKYVNEDGSFIEPPKFKKKSFVREWGKFYQVDKDGSIVGEFFNLSVAAKAVNADLRNIWRVLNKVHRFKTVKGYSFVFPHELSLP